MKCPNLETWTAFYGGELEEAATRRMADHLQSCYRCQDEFDQLCGLGASLRGLLGGPLRPASGQAARARAPLASTWPLAAAAILFLAAGSLWWMVRESPPDRLPRVAHKPAAREETRAAPPPEIRPTVEKVAASPAPEKEEIAKIAESPLRAPEPVAADAAPPPAPSAPSLASPQVTESPQAAPKTVSEPARTLGPGRILATIERVEGEVVVLTAGLRVPARHGQGVGTAEGLATVSPRSRAVLRFADGTRAELGERTLIRQFQDRAGERGIGKWVDLSEGTLTVDAAHQPADRALVIASPHAEARIVGTVFRLLVEPGDKGSTRLEVLEGKVRLAREGSGVDVYGGFSATASPGGELAARPLGRMPVDLLFRYSFEDGRLPKCFSAGTLGRGPDRPGNRFCVSGVAAPGATNKSHVSLIEDGKGLFNYNDELFLAFDYWAGEPSSTLDIQVWSRAQQTTFGVTIPNVPREQWTHLSVPLAEFARPGPEGLLHLKPGEAVPTLWIQPGQPGATLYLDNLELFRIRRKEGKR